MGTKTPHRRAGTIPDWVHFADFIAFSTPEDSLENLNRLKIKKTIYHGEVIANEGQLIVDFPEKKHKPLPNSVILAKKYEPQDFTIDIGSEYAGKNVFVRVMGLQDGIETKELVEIMYTEDGTLHPIPERDISKLVVVGRHEASKGNVGKGFVKGIILQINEYLMSPEIKGSTRTVSKPAGIVRMDSQYADSPGGHASNIND